MKLKELLMKIDLDCFLTITNIETDSRIELDADNTFLEMLGDFEVNNIFAESLHIYVCGQDGGEKI